MVNVLKFTQRNEPEPKVWQCQCGHYGFWLYSTGQVICASCEGEATDMRGFWRVPAEPNATTQELTGNNVRHLFPSSESNR